MLSTAYLIHVADAYKAASGLTEDTTVSYRVFGDTKKLTAIRCGADITVRRFNVALDWFRSHWPDGRPFPESNHVGDEVSR